MLNVHRLFHRSMRRLPPADLPKGPVLRQPTPAAAAAQEPATTRESAPKPLVTAGGGKPA